MIEIDSKPLPRHSKQIGWGCVKIHWLIIQQTSLIMPNQNEGAPSQNQSSISRFISWFIKPFQIETYKDSVISEFWKRATERDTLKIVLKAAIDASEASNDDFKRRNSHFIDRQ